MSDLAKPESFQEIVRDRVRTIIMEAVPASEIDKLVKREYDSFFEDSKDPYNRHQVSPFKTMVKGFLQDQIKELVKKEVESVLLQEYNPSGMGRKVMQDTVREMTPIVMQAMSETLISAALEQFRQSLASNRTY